MLGSLAGNSMYPPRCVRHCNTFNHTCCGRILCCCICAVSIDIVIASRHVRANATVSISTLDNIMLHVIMITFCLSPITCSPFFFPFLSACLWSVRPADRGRREAWPEQCWPRCPQRAATRKGLPSLGPRPGHRDLPLGGRPRLYCRHEEGPMLPCS